MHRMAIWTLLYAIALYSAPVWAATPVNPATNANAAMVLDHLEQLPQRSDGRMLSGQFCNYGLSAMKQPCKEVYQVTGLWPAIIGLDYADWSTSGAGFARLEGACRRPEEARRNDARRTDSETGHCR